jgi:hypothetical protein
VNEEESWACGECDHTDTLGRSLSPTALWDEGYILAEPDDQTIEGKIMGFVEAIDEIVLADWSDLVTSHPTD